MLGVLVLLVVLVMFVILVLIVLVIVFLLMLGVGVVVGGFGADFVGVCVAGVCVVCSVIDCISYWDQRHQYSL